MSTPHLIATRAHRHVQESNRINFAVFMRDGVIDPEEQAAIDAGANAERFTRASATERSVGICFARSQTRDHLIQLFDAHMAAIDELPDMVIERAEGV